MDPKGGGQVHRSLGIGVALVILAIIATMVVNIFHYSIALYAITGGIGCLSCVLAGVMSGLFGRRGQDSTRLLQRPG
jgi:hypothetical protein